MGAMTVVKKDHTLVKINNGILAIGGALSEETLIEIYNRDFDFWTPMPQWTRPFNSISGHCAVGISYHEILILGYSYRSGHIQHLCHS